MCKSSVFIIHRDSENFRTTLNSFHCRKKWVRIVMQWLLIFRQTVRYRTATVLKQFCLRTDKVWVSSVRPARNHVHGWFLPTLMWMPLSGFTTTLSLGRKSCICQLDSQAKAALATPATTKFTYSYSLHDSLGQLETIYRHHIMIWLEFPLVPAVVLFHLCVLLWDDCCICKGEHHCAGEVTFAGLGQAVEQWPISAVAWDR